MIRVAAAGDLHFGPDSAGTLRPHVERIDERADVLLLAGDLTKVGLPEEAEVLAEELREAPVPVIAVLGNHDYHSDQPDAVRRTVPCKPASTPPVISILTPGRSWVCGVSGAPDSIRQFTFCNSAQSSS